MREEGRHINVFEFDEIACFASTVISHDEMGWGGGYAKVRGSAQSSKEEGRCDVSKMQNGCAQLQRGRRCDVSSRSKRSTRE